MRPVAFVSSPFLSTVGTSPVSRIEPFETFTGAGPGSGYLRFVRSGSGSQTVLERRFAASPLRLLAPRGSRPSAWVYAATLGGGLVGGDAVRMKVDVAPDARAFLATQASTKVYRSATPSSQHLYATVGDDGLLAVVPDPIVCFAGSSFSQEQEYDLATGATLVVVDWVTSGRHATGERWLFDRYASRIDLRRGGRRILYDGVRLAGEDGAIARRMGRFNVYLLLLMIGPLARHAAGRTLALVNALPLERRADLLVSAAPLDEGGALLRMAGTSVEQVSAAVREHLRFLVPLLGDDPWLRKW
jgi:urease accessory protein